MERNFIRSDSLMETEFLTEPGALMHYHENIELLYLMSGGMDVTIEDRTLKMAEGDVVVVNANRRHACAVKGNALILRILISSYKAMQQTGRNPVLFWCDSTGEDGGTGAYEELRRITLRIIDAVVKREHGRSSLRIYLDSLYYLLLHHLVTNFMVEAAAMPGEDEKDGDDRISDIFSYIRLNYRSSISLQDLADHLYLSPTYVSKYISKKCGISFVELLNSVRLTHAIEDLIYTDNYVMKVAMDNGFASVAAFNKVFREAHNMTPSEYRNQLRDRHTENADEQVREQEIREKVESYVETHPVTDGGGAERIEMRAEMDVSAEPLFSWRNGDSMITHVGGAENLLKTSFQEQLLMAKERIGIKYVCFWGIYSPDLNISVHPKDGKWGFRGLDIVIDFLIQNGMKPYIEISSKPKRLLKNPNEALLERHPEDEFESEEEMEGFFRSMMRHFVHRYGEDEVAEWLFDYQEREKLEFSDLVFRFIAMTDEGHEAYFRRFDVIAGAFRGITERVRLGGGEFPLQHYGEDGFLHILKLWKKHPEQPDFLTITSFPYKIQSDGKYAFEKRTTNPDFVFRNAEIAARCMETAGYGGIPLHVMEYGMTLSNRNIINDSCAKGSFVMRTVIDAAGRTPMLGHFMFTDVYSDYLDVYGLLFGGSGLLTANGIPKPAFYAYEFVNQLYATVIARGENYLVTANGRGSYRIVCHSNRELSYQYYMTEENELKIRDIEEMAADNRPLKMSFSLSGVKNGVYQIKKKQVNRQSGSIQDEWMQLNMDPDLTQSEYDYLRNMSTPRLAIADYIAKDGRIAFETELAPNEIQMIQILQH